MDAYRDQYAQLFHGGKDITLLAISVDPDTTLAAWAHERGYPFHLLSDSGGVVGRQYGAWNAKYGLDNRSLFVVGPDGKIAYVAAPFREIDPSAYTELGDAIQHAVGR
jgi:thioredoxin-dependent peroxiredoxin